VAGDVRNGFITVDDADAIYGVDVDPRTFAVAALSERRTTPASGDEGSRS
jgi:hypothetical protein